MLLTREKEIDELIKIFAANKDNTDTLKLDLDSWLDDFGTSEYDGGWSEGYDVGQSEGYADGQDSILESADAG